MTKMREQNEKQINSYLNFSKMNALRNKVQLIGNLGKDPELKQFDSGKSCARLTIATKEIYKNQRGEKVTETQWHNNVVAYGKIAENISKVLRKGHEVGIHGKLQHRSYEDKQGNTRYVSEIIVRDFILFNGNNGRAF